MSDTASPDPVDSAAVVAGDGDRDRSADDCSASSGNVPCSGARGRRRRPRRWHDIDPARRGVVMLWVGFTVTFLIARLVTGVIKLGSSDAGNLDVGGLHLHHYLWGILLTVAVAVFGLVDRSARARTVMGAVLGVGIGLIVDEAALLVTLKDVYWTAAGWSSVAVAVAVISVLGTVLVVTRSGRHDQQS